MNESTALDWTWFNTSKGTVGIAKIKAYGGKFEYRICPVDGFMEKMDVQQIIAWGAHFPEAAGKALFERKS
jgi:hypothetical protein